MYQPYSDILVLRNYYIMLDKEQKYLILKFLSDWSYEPTKDQVTEFFSWNFVHPDYYTDYLSQVLRNVLDVTFDNFKELNNSKKIYYLNSIANLISITLSFKIWEYQLGRKDANWWWKGTPNYYLYPSNLIKDLEELRVNGLEVDYSSSSTSVFAVEGISEKTFVQELYELTRFMNLDADIHNYNGKGEVTNLVNYINEKTRQGVKVNLICDADGNIEKTNAFISKLEKRCNIKSKFIFKKDFESAMPPAITSKVLNAYFDKYKLTSKGISPEDVLRIIDSNIPLIKYIEQANTIEMNKRELALLYAREFAPIIKTNWNRIFNERDITIYGDEIYEFLMFIIRN